jgi:hypothetical protein
MNFIIFDDISGKLFIPKNLLLQVFLARPSK